MGRASTTVVLLMLAAIASNATANDLPSQVDLRPRFETLGLAPRHQGTRNTCSLFAVTACANYAWSAAGTPKSPVFSEEFLVWAANEATGRRGDQAMFYEAVQGLNQLGIPGEASCLYHASGKTERPADSTIAAAGENSGRWRAHWIKLWSTKSGLTDGQLIAIKQTLADGRPVACGLRWPRSKKPAELLTVPPASAVQDGHSIVFVGYQDDEGVPGGGYFVLRNSYGPEWEESGYGRMAYAYAGKYANDSLWIELGPPRSEVPTHRIEAESLALVEQTGCRTQNASMRRYGSGMWSGGHQLQVAAEPEATGVWQFTVPQTGPYRVRLVTTAAPGYGIITAQLDDQLPTQPMDLYAGRTCPGASLELGTHRLEGGEHRLRVTVVGKNELSADCGFGLDALDLLPATPKASL